MVGNRRGLCRTIYEAWPEEQHKVAGRAYGVWTGAVVNCQERYNWRTPDKSDEESIGSAADMNIDDIDDNDDDDVM